MVVVEGEKEVEEEGEKVEEEVEKAEEDSNSSRMADASHVRFCWDFGPPHEDWTASVSMGQVWRIASAPRAKRIEEAGGAFSPVEVDAKAIPFSLSFLSKGEVEMRTCRGE